jgi:hypothetical protein
MSPPPSRSRRTNTDSEIVVSSPHVRVARHLIQIENASRSHAVITLECPDWVSVVPVTPDGSLSVDAVLEMLDQMAALQRSRVINLAQRLRPGLTPDDLQNPHDFPELADPDWHFYDGQLVALEGVIIALRARLAEGAGGSDAACPRTKADPAHTR